MDGWVDGWMGGWMDGWMDGKAGLRIAYSNQKWGCNLSSKVINVTVEMVKDRTL